jgi:threonyl-tRNA synthetase
VIGAREAETGALSLRSRRQGDLGSVALDSLLSAATRANRQKDALLQFEN